MCIKKIHQRGTGRGARAVMEVFVLFRSLLIRTPPFHGVGVCRLLLFSWWTCPFRGNSNGTAYLHVINGVFSSSFQTSDLVASAACFLSFCVVQLELVFDSGTRFLSCNNVFLPNLCSSSHLSSVYSITLYCSEHVCCLERLRSRDFGWLVGHVLARLVRLAIVDSQWRFRRVRGRPMMSSLMDRYSLCQISRPRNCIRLVCLDVPLHVPIYKANNYFLTC